MIEYNYSQGNGGDKVENKKKAAEILKEIDSDLDTVLSILTKLALVAMSIKTIAEILMNI